MVVMYSLPIKSFVELSHFKVCKRPLEILYNPYFNNLMQLTHRTLCLGLAVTTIK